MSSRSISNDVTPDGVKIVKTTYSELLEIIKKRNQFETTDNATRTRRTEYLQEERPQCEESRDNSRSSNYHVISNQCGGSTGSSGVVTMTTSPIDKVKESSAGLQRNEQKRQKESGEGGVLYVKHSDLESNPRKNNQTSRMARQQTDGDSLSHDPHSELTHLEDKLSGALARWDGRPSTFNRTAHIWYVYRVGAKLLKIVGTVNL